MKTRRWCCGPWQLASGSRMKIISSHHIQGIIISCGYYIIRPSPPPSWKATPGHEWTLIRIGGQSRCCSRMIVGACRSISILIQIFIPKNTKKQQVTHQSNLQIENPHQAGNFIDAPPIQDTIVMNIGDLMQRWTNGVYNISLSPFPFPVLFSSIFPLLFLMSLYLSPLHPHKLTLHPFLPSLSLSHIQIHSNPPFTA